MERERGRQRLGLWRLSSLVGLLCSLSTAHAQTPNGSQFQVNSYTTSNQSYPAVADRSEWQFCRRMAQQWLQRHRY